MIFGNPRQALAYLYAHHRGPTASRPKYHDAPGGTGRSHWDGTMVGAMLYGLRSAGCCGVERGGQLDLDLKHWATTAGSERTDDIRAIDRKLRAILRHHGLLAERRRVQVPRVHRWTDPDGASWTRLARVPATSEKSPCADGLDVAMIP